MIPKKLIDKSSINMQDIADIAAVTGESYFRGAFRKKEFDGEKWAKAKIDDAGKRKRGSLMVDSAALMKSVRTSKSTPKEVVWSAGNDKVPYAKVHNEGGQAGRGKGFTMPQRQFMGDSTEMQKQITTRVNKYIKAQFK